MLRFKLTHGFTSFIVLLLHGYAGYGYASSTIAIVSSNSHFAVVHRIEAAIYSQPLQKIKLVHIITGTDREHQLFEQKNHPSLIVTIGSEALANVLKYNSSVPILSILCRKSTFHSLLKQYHHELNDKSHPISAIYLDQPLKRHLDLVQCLFDTPSPIGVLFGPESVTDQEQLNDLARERKLQLTSIFINRSENPVAVLDGLLNDAKVILVLPDSRIYSSKTARGMLLTAFHKRVPLIGYSKTFVNNGALAAVYSTTKQLADHTAREIKMMAQNNYLLPPSQYPAEFTIAVNFQVAGSLGLAIQNETIIKNSMDLKKT